jgi:hypothetical protein
MIELFLPMGLNKYDICRILLVKCYIEYPVFFRSYIRNISSRNHLLRGGIINLYLGLVRVKYPRYRGSSVMAQNFRYHRFPLAANRWRTIHHIPDKVPPLQAEEEGPPN